MNVRRVLLLVAVLLGSVVALAPTADAKPAACAWVSPYGVCIDNPFPALPVHPSLP